MCCNVYLANQHNVCPGVRQGPLSCPIVVAYWHAGVSMAVNEQIESSRSMEPLLRALLQSHWHHKLSCANAAQAGHSTYTKHGQFCLRHCLCKFCLLYCLHHCYKNVPMRQTVLGLLAHHILCKLRFSPRLGRENSFGYHWVLGSILNWLVMLRLFDGIEFWLYCLIQ